MKYRSFVGTAVLFGCDIWSDTVGGVHRLMVFENRVLRGIFGPKEDEVTCFGEECVTRSLMICTGH
jgi:hypothetical protein